MLGSLTAAAFVILMFIFPHAAMEEQTPRWLSILHYLWLLPCGLLICQMFLWLMIQLPLERVEEKLVPGINELLINDRGIKSLNSALFLLALALLFTILAGNYLAIAHPQYLLGGIIMGIGISLDVFTHLMRRVFAYLNPQSILEIIGTRGKNVIASGKEEDICDLIDTLSVISLKSLIQHNTSLCNQSLQEATFMLQSYLEASSKKFEDTSHTADDFKDSEEKAHFMLFYLFDRLDTIYKKALELNVESICSSIMTQLGKLALHAAKYKVSLATHPIQQLGRITLESAERKNDNLSLKGTCTLVELSKAIATNVNPELPDFADPHLSAILQLDAIGKEIFRRDKATNIQLLTYPFSDLKAFFRSAPRDKIPSTAVIIKELDRIIAEWDTLETVMRTMPTPKS
jgi:hypothetical protein